MSVVVPQSNERIGVFAMKLVRRSRPRGRAWSIAAVWILLSTFPLLGGGKELQREAGKEELPIADVVRVMAETARVTEVALAPDGTCVVYTVARGNIGANSHTSELLLQNLDAEGRPHGAPKVVAQSTGQRQPTFTPEWRPGGRSFSYRLPQDRADTSDPRSPTERPPLVLYDVESGRSIPIAIRQDGAPRVSGISLRYQWSPKGRFLAFTAIVGDKKTRLDPRKGIVQSADVPFRAGRSVGIYVLDMESGKLEQVTPDDMAVASFDWSPDERQIVFVSGDGLYDSGFARGRLQVVDRATSSVRTLVRSQTYYRHPKWSPDGKWVASATMSPGEKGLGEYWLSVVSTAAVGNVTRFSDPGVPPVGEILGWTPDRRSVFYVSGYHMAAELVRADIVEARFTFVTQPDDEFTNTEFSFSEDRRRVAFMRSSYSSPWELYVQGLPDQAPRAVTSVSSAFPLRDLVRIERVDWPSQDGKFTIHGMLLTPKGALPDGDTRPASPLPTVVYSYGGPTMVRIGFDVDGYHGGMLPLAARGYAVLTANTRGRGGYGDELQRALANDGASFRGPYQDVMAGVDVLVKKGLADPERLGVFGHSYGANLTTYIITQSDRFKAAAIHEALMLDLIDIAITAPGGRLENEVFTLSGIRDPLSEDAMKQLVHDSSRFHLGRINTPTLLQFGAHSAAPNIGQTLFSTMLRLKVPNEFVVYDSGHGVVAPAAIADELARVGAWFDYWLRGMPYPDQARAAEYEAWQSTRETRQQTSH